MEEQRSLNPLHGLGTFDRCAIYVFVGGMIYAVCAQL